MLDSGSGASIMSTALAAKLGLNNGERRMISGLSAKAPVSIGVQKGPPIGVQKGPPSSSSVTGMTGALFVLVAA